MQRCTPALVAFVALAASFTTGVGSLASGHPTEYVLAIMLGSALGVALGSALGFDVSWPKPDPAAAPGLLSSEGGRGRPFTRAELCEVVAVVGDSLTNAAASAAFAARGAAAWAWQWAVGAALRCNLVSARPFGVRLDGRHCLRVLDEVGVVGFCPHPYPPRDSMQLARALWCHLDGNLEALPRKYGCLPRLVVRCVLEGPAGPLEVVIHIDALVGEWRLYHPGGPGSPDCSCHARAGPRAIPLRDARAQALLRPLLRRGRSECARIAAAVG